MTTQAIIEEHEAIEGWHFLPIDRRLQFEPRTPVEPGSTLTVDPPLELCGRGLHASARAIDALQYAPGPIICRVRVWGKVILGDDKLCGQFRRCLWLADATETLHRFACEVAKEALDLIASKGSTVDPRSYRSIEVKLAWLRGEASDKELAAARGAARDAAWAAAWDAARAAAWAAARDATWAAARGAARDAAWAAARAAARDAAWGAAWDAARAAAMDAAMAAAWVAAWGAARDAQEQRLSEMFSRIGGGQTS